MEVIEFGPARAIGISAVGKGGDGAFAYVWMDHLLPRMNEVQIMPGGGSFGICRMLPNQPDGDIEYTAAFETTDDAPIPTGMIECFIPSGKYFVKRVESLDTIGESWQEASAEYRQANPGGPHKIDFPAFEYYPPEFQGRGPLYIYFPE